MDCGRWQEKTAMKLIVDSATDKVLGVCMLGPDAAEKENERGMLM